MLLKCLNCDARRLDITGEQCVCPRCGAAWPFTAGIARFFELPDYYWGEIGRNEARQLLEAARKGSWAEAIRARFPQGDLMALGVLDLQRASWATMLGLGGHSVALDVGSGYGAITHSLARLAGEVYSIEAIPERIEFTRERLRQEGIENVRLIQASAIQLPLLEKSFDLVVANGVLEWVGEWDLEGDAHSAQLRFLNSLSRLLKDDGVLVIGIENRFGYYLFLGQNDHSGLPYTSLVPRRMASAMLRRSQATHHRTTLNPGKEYRTYTYSKRGYRKLLTDAGFQDVTCYWADPGYNQPYHLVPLSRAQWVREHFRNLVDHPGTAPRQSWRRTLKRSSAFSWILSWIVPEFVLLASKRRGRTTELDCWAEESLAKVTGQRNHGANQTRPIPWSLHTGPFKPKSIVRLGDPISNRDLAYIKISLPEGNGAGFEVEAMNRAKVQDALRASACRAIRVPETYGRLHVGNTSYWMESAAPGMQLCRILRQAGYFADRERIASDLGQVFESLIELTNSLQTVRDAPVIDPGWYEIPEEFRNSGELRDALEKRRYFAHSLPHSGRTWVQHGDLSVENIAWDATTAQMTVFDWPDMAAGLPPLYDFFSFLCSFGYLPPREETVRFGSERERWTASFAAVFFSDAEFARLARKLMIGVCERLNVQPELIPALLLEFSIIRTHHYRTTSAVQRDIHLRLLELCLERNCSVLGFSASAA